MPHTELLAPLMLSQSFHLRRQISLLVTGLVKERAVPPGHRGPQVLKLPGMSQAEILAPTLGLAASAMFSLSY